KEAQRLVAALTKVRTVLDAGRPARNAELSKEERTVLAPLFLLTMKPTMYVANVGEDGSARLLQSVRGYAAKEGAPVVPITASIEAQIADMSDEDKKLFLEDLGMDEPGLNRVVRAAYGLLGLQTYFTAGPKEVRAWTVRAGATAPQAARVLPTDFERGFHPDPGKQKRALEAILANPGIGKLFVAREGKRVIAMASLLYTVSTAEGGKAAWFEDLVVHPEERKRGIGEALLKQVVAQARAEG